MKIYITGVFVDDQQKALKFYTEKLGFEVKHDIPMGEHRWLTLTSSGDPDGVELLLEPAGHPAVAPYRTALVADNIPLASFRVEDLEKEYQRLTGLGVTFTMQPTEAGGVMMATLDDTCGNLIQLIQFED